MAFVTGTRLASDTSILITAVTRMSNYLSTLDGVYKNPLRSYQNTKESNPVNPVILSKNQTFNRFEATSTLSPVFRHGPIGNA